MPNEDGEWSSWRNFVLAAIKENANNIEKIEVCITEIRIDVGRLKLLSVILGGIAGMLGTLLVMLVYKMVVIS